MVKLNNLNLKKITEDLIDTFLEAGNIARNKRDSGLKITIKTDKSPVTDGKGNTTLKDDKLSVPLLSIVNVPNLSVKKATVDFSMEVKASSSNTSSSQTDANVSTTAKYKSWWSPVSVEMTASVSTSQKSESVRKTDNSAKYDVHVEARDDGAPEGLMKVLDILNAAIVPNGDPTPNPAQRVAEAVVVQLLKH